MTRRGDPVLPGQLSFVPISPDDRRSPADANPVIDCSGEKLITRQELDVDLDGLVARGMDSVRARSPEYQVVDFDDDLQSAFRSVSQVREAFERLDPEVRARFGNWPSVLAGLSSGVLAVVDGRVVQVPRDKGTVPPAGSSGGGAVPSPSPEGAAGSSVPPVGVSAS